MNWFKNFICDWVHGGGDIKRDEFGRINWQCRKCGRWADEPVQLAQENRMIDRDIAAAHGAQGETK